MKLLLYAEDDSDTRESMVQIFSLIENVNLLVAEDGAKAISLLSPDLDMVLADYRMPFHTGDEVMREAKMRSPHATRVILSAYGSEDLDSSSADVVLRKPLDLGRAIEMVQELGKS